MAGTKAQAPWAIEEDEAELRRLTERLQQSTVIKVGWRRRSGGIINGANCVVQMPGERGVHEATDAEIASIVKLDLAGTAVVSWPWVCGARDDDEIPVDPAILEIVSLL